MLLFLLILIAATVAQIFLPWWCIVPVAFLLALLVGRTGGKAFLAGFFGVGLGWLVLAIWLNGQNNSVLAHRVAELLPLSGSIALLLLVTIIVGGLVGGLAALSGCWLRQALWPIQPPVAPVVEMEPK
ncbi:MULTISPECIES: hypothetical protein [Hymenobacter]|uniref:Uncharacterized protein n=1 Tax=Hymenobacter profundi TaxID=1982110 RepID=A0ABS6X419_9BACT|nr:MULTISPECIES: hypothetical protein [Hymenobacter]MBW3130584.1 hypothetical protein [Hymenobacter profundi]QNE41497.1 hypothetical protein F1C16_18980 [Hymenobacter sp. NBH84]